MRWPLSLLFRGDRDAPAAAGGRAGGSDAPAAGPGASADAAGAYPGGTPARSAAWAGLPPVQRAVRPAPLTAPAIPFGRGLAGRRTPDPILRPLAHDVAADGPAGLVSGLAIPLVTQRSPVVAPHGESADLPVAPGAAGARRPHGGHRASEAAAPVRAQASEATSGAPDAAPADRAGDAGGAAKVPPWRSLPVVDAPDAAALAATRVATPTAPEAARAVAPARETLQRAAPGPGSRAVSSPGLASGGTAGARGGSSVEAASAAGTTAGAGHASGSNATTGDSPSAPEPGVVQRRSLGESRRMGLGAPLTSRPVALGTPGRPADAASLPLARAARSAAPTPATTVAPPGRSAAAAPGPLPVLRAAATGGDAADARGLDAPPRDSSDETGAGETAGGGPAASIPGTPIASRPLLGDPGRALATPPPAVEDEAPDTDLADAASGGPSIRRAGHADHVAGAGTGVPPGGQDGGPGRAAAGATTAPAGPGSSGAAAGSSWAAPAPGSAARATAPLVVARAARGSGVPLRPSVATIPEGPPPVIARVAAPAGPGSLPVHPVGATSGHSAASRTAAGVPATPVPPAATLPSTGPWAGPPAAGRSPRAAGRSAAFDSSNAVSAAPPLALAGRPPVQRDAAAVGDADEATSEPATTTVARLADAPAPESVPGRVLGWSPGDGFAALPPAGGPYVQRAVTVGEVSAEVGGGAGAGEAGGAGAGQDDEEMAERIYERIRSRFATELLLDRERMGLLIDG